jgi:hypothetical protein
MTTTMTHPTLRAAYYVDWADITTALALTENEIEEANIAIGQHYTWGDSGLTLVSVEVIAGILHRTLWLPPCNVTEQEFAQMMATYNAMTKDAAYINLEN